MPFTARSRFAAALVLFVAWVGGLATMAVTSATRPPSLPVNDGPAREIAPTQPISPRNDG
jgi:hypothetical protein